ncbi:NeuD/PglB/VioB family sugar acetyltransferase [Micromonosporaceae bacterium B7E4]
MRDGAGLDLSHPGQRRASTPVSARGHDGPRREVGTGSLVVLGTSGHAREILTIAEAAGGYELLGCLGPHRAAELARLPVDWLGPDDWLRDADDNVRYVLGVGSGAVRTRLDGQLGPYRRTPARLVHPAAVVGPAVELGPGTVLWPGAVLTADIVTGRHVHVSTNVSVGHDAVLADFATLLPGCTVAGSARIGAGATVGASATVIDGISVGAGAMVGAGAAVVRDVPAGAVVVGVPARPMERRDH